MKIRHILGHNSDDDQETPPRRRYPNQEVPMDRRSILERPFPRERVRQRSSPDGVTLSYVSAADVIDRLNEAYTSDWSFTVVEHRFDGDEVIVTGRLKAGDVTKEDFGGARLNGGTRADALKAATSDALRRCARMLGVGLDLWRGGGGDAIRTSPPPAAPPARRGPTATVAQVRMLRNIGSERKLDVDKLAIERCGVPVSELGRREASNLISELIDSRPARRTARR
jgi:hypothetical protein